MEYKKTTETSFGSYRTTVHTNTATTATITGLDDDTSYQVRVRATNNVDDGPWSLSGVGSTNKEDNALPTFGAGEPSRGTCWRILIRGWSSAPR